MRRTAPFAKGLISFLVLLLLNACVNPSGDVLRTPDPIENTPEPTVLIISEYVEGSSFNKALEISNIGESAADLTDYVVEIYSGEFDTSTWPDVTPTKTILLGLRDSESTILSIGECYVLVDFRAEQALLDLCDQESDDMDFNGDDAVLLKYGDSVVDSIGCIGEDPGAEWGLDAATTRDATLRRKDGISVGDTDPCDDFNPDDEWECFPMDSFDDLGRYDPSEG